MRSASAVVPESNSFEKRLQRTQYLTDEAGVELLAGFYASALAVGATARTSYLRVLIAGTLNELGEKPRLTPPKTRLPAPDIEADLRAAKAVHVRYYEAVLRGVTTKDIEIDEKLKKSERAARFTERSKRANFARSSFSTLRAFIQAGGNIRAEVITEVTKGRLAKFVTRKKLRSPEGRDAAVEHAVNQVLALAESLKDPNDGLAVVQMAIAKLSHRVGEWSAITTTSPRKAAEKNLMLKTSEGLFWPIGAEAQQLEARLAVKQGTA